jgi:hypothetical protein
MPRSVDSVPLGCEFDLTLEEMSYIKRVHPVWRASEVPSLPSNVCAALGRSFLLGV